jgi:hypothetical protein
MGIDARNTTMSRRPVGGTSRGGLRYVVTLQTSGTPMPVKLPAGLTIAGVSVFRSRSMEDSRELFRLQLGYFESPTDAEAVLASVRPHYPTALIDSTPVEDSGSLDDTINTAFSLVRGAVARLVTTDDSAAAADRVPAATEPPPAAAPEAPAPTLTPGEVASVLAPQRYAVQLDWSLKRIDPASVPRLGIFRAYSLYAVSVLRQGSPEHGLRLGFFKNLEGACQVADYVRHAFPHASVVPVSYREFTRASELVRPQSSTAQARAASALEVTKDGTAASTPAGAAAQPTPAVTPKTAPDGGRTEPPPTREQLLALLGAHGLEMARDRDDRVTLTAEERALLLRPERSLRNW